MGSCTNMILAESFLLYFAVLILLEAVAVVGTGLGAGWSTRGNPAHVCSGASYRELQKSQHYLVPKQVLKGGTHVSGQPVGLVEVRAAGHLQSYFAWGCWFLIAFGIETGQRYFFSDKVLIPILI